MKKVLRKISHFILTFVRITEVRFTNPYQFLVKDNEAYQDDIEGHTFFMESNRRSKEIASRYGIQLPVIQQTFIIPELHLLPFLQSLAGMLQAKQLTPSLFDIVPIAVDDILMSASRGLNGFAVSVAFEDLYRSTILELHRQLEAAIAVCNDLGGRVYLVKKRICDIRTTPCNVHKCNGAFPSHERTTRPKEHPI